MNADQARQALLVRAAEVEPGANAVAPRPTSSLWSAADSAWADGQALRQLGENASGEQYLIERARLAADRLAERNPTMAMLRRGGGSSGRAVIIALLVGLALLAGLATDALGPAQRVNLLAPPLLALMLWNLAVYAVLLTHAGWRILARPDRQTAPGWFEQGASTLMRKLSARRLPADAPAAAHRFAADWLLAIRPINAARLAALLHMAALAVAAGALLALYARGLAFEFKAGWDSTFVGADTVHRWLSLLLAPAQAISGQALPDAAHLETLRFSTGGGGENAARWIHWYAITTGLVMLPRAALTVAAIVRARHLRRHFPLALNEPYFQRLLQGLARASGKTAQLVAVLPYGHRMAGDLAPRIAASVDAELGPGLHLKILANITPGAEDELAGDWPRAALADADVHWLIPLFALSATPERETHGAFLRIVQQRAAALPGRPQCRVMIDESGFRQRISAADLPRRLAERRTAWQKLLDEQGAGQALFADLGGGPVPSHMGGSD